MAKKVLITGALGQLGHSVLQQLHQKYYLIPTDIRTSSSIENYTYLDITNRAIIEEILSKINPDVIINLAAYTDVDGCELNQEKAELLNTKSVEMLIDEFSGKFIQISTDYVFDGNLGPYDENDSTNPLSVYGKTKLNAEKIVEDKSVDWCILRTNVLFDYYEGTEASFIKWVIDSLKSKKSINIVNDQWNNPTWTKNLAEVIELVIENDVKGLHHYAGADYLNRFEFAEIVADIFNLDKNLIVAITTKSLKQPAKRPLKGGLISSKIEQTLNIKGNKLYDILKLIKARMR